MSKKYLTVLRVTKIEKDFVNIYMIGYADRDVVVPRTLFDNAGVDLLLDQRYMGYANIYAENDDELDLHGIVKAASPPKEWFPDAEN